MALRIEGLVKAFGGLTAVSGLNLDLGDRDIQGIIGPNGAGKTTVFNLITGIYQPDRGRLRLGEQELTGLAPDAIARAGIARTFQNIRLFAHMTVLDNITMALHGRAGYSLWEAVLRTGNYRRQETRLRVESRDHLARFGLADRQQELAGSLPYGEQRRLEIARALATGPKVLLLDEPAAGMNPKEVEELILLIRQVHRDFPLAILLIEHQMPVVLELCAHIQVLDFGQTIAAGAPQDVTRNPLVIEAYLGEAEAPA
ncbi:MAG: ABC transporter ATP-binding protein [Holophagaceae bacterium]|uniref:ABC transporter ATP-binding protein n=1 Tax=Candidatus Geothrix skivensis TaxID=2954439 RepID=A0A9D7SJB1_9BACT|nr:ABC transporter ATP-binding protein [Candidatus Geothrix skivensis]